MQLRFLRNFRVSTFNTSAWNF